MSKKADDAERAAQEPAAEELRRRCSVGNLYTSPLDLRVWVGRSACFGNKWTVCYNGPLGHCEAAEKFIIPRLSREMPEARFCYLWMG